MLPTLDLRPLQEGHATRGIGRYVATLAAALPFPRFVVWSELPIPRVARGAELVRVTGSPRPGRLGWVQDARRGRGITDVVHVPVADVRLARPRPRYVTAFDAIPWRFPDDYPAGRLGALRRRGDVAVARTAPVVLTCSEASARDLERFCRVPPASLRVVPLTAGAPWPDAVAGGGRARPEVPRHGRRYVVAAGGFQHRDPRKRLGDLLEALARLPRDVGLVVTGTDGPEARGFIERATALGVADQVELTGHLAAEDLVEVFGGAAAFAFPSAWEGFGLPLVEAMSVGLPCVVTDGGALPEVAGDAAAIVPVGSPDDLAQALRAVLDDSAAAAEASRRAVARASTFSVRRFAEAHLAVYEST